MYSINIITIINNIRSYRREDQHHHHHGGGGGGQEEEEEHRSGGGGGQHRGGIGDERVRMVQQAHRDDCTVMVMGIHPKCTEKEVYVFMSQNAGKVRDVQVIRDPRNK